MGIQLVIGFLYLFKGSLGQNSKRLVLGLRDECIESCDFSSLMFSSLFLCFLSITMSS